MHIRRSKKCIPLYVSPLLMGMALSAHALTPAEVFEQVKDSVVVIRSFDVKGKKESMGSGVLLPNGNIATNCHVVEDGVRFEAGSRNQFVPATVIAGDTDKDICLLQAPAIKGKPARLGRAATLKVGEAVYAVGAPQGLELSLSDGIVSQLRGGNPPFIQTTAAISQGSSGGGLFDQNAKLVGFTTLYIEGGQSLNFAMPVEWVAEIRTARNNTARKRSQTDWFKQAMALEESKNWPELLLLGKKWSEAEPNNANAWFFIGASYAFLNRYADAVQSYRQAIRINPESALAWYNVGNGYVNLKRYSDAVESYQQAVRINPEYAEAWSNLGVAYSKLSRHTDAVQSYQQAIRINPESALAWHNLGNEYVNLERYSDAAESYQQAIRINPEFAEAWYNLGNVYVDLKRYSDAEESYRQAIRNNPEFAKAWHNLGISYVLLGNKSAALKIVQTLKYLNPKMSDDLFNVVMP